MTSLLPLRRPGLAPSSPTTHATPFAALAQISVASQPRLRMLCCLPHLPADEGRGAGRVRRAAAARVRVRSAQAAALMAELVALVARVERSWRPAEPPGGGLSGADDPPAARDLASARLQTVGAAGGSGAAPMGRARPGSGPRSRQASLERRRRVCAAAVVAHTRTWHISHYITFSRLREIV